MDNFFLIASRSAAGPRGRRGKHLGHPAGMGPAKMARAHGGCLGIGSRRRTRQAAISSGEGQTPAITPRSPNGATQQGPIPCYLPPESIGRQGTTRGTETSKYPEEEKSTEIARVAASESAPAQTHARVSGEALPHGGCGTGHLQARALQAQSQREAQPNRHGKAGRSG